MPRRPRSFFCDVKEKFFFLLAKRLLNRHTENSMQNPTGVSVRKKKRKEKLNKKTRKKKIRMSTKEADTKKTIKTK